MKCLKEYIKLRGNRWKTRQEIWKKDMDNVTPAMG